MDASEAAEAAEGSGDAHQQPDTFWWTGSQQDAGGDAALSSTASLVARLATSAEAYAHSLIGLTDALSSAAASAPSSNVDLRFNLLAVA